VITERHWQEFTKSGGANAKIPTRIGAVWAEAIKIPLIIELPEPSALTRFPEPPALIVSRPALLDFKEFLSRVLTFLPQLPVDKSLERFESVVCPETK